MKNVTVVKMMMMETLRCFNCGIEKPLEKFKDNKRKYQVKSAKGKCIVCKACSFHKALNTLSVVRYNFEENNFKVIHFKDKYEVLDFYETEGGEL
jgi:hypothetical protein